MHAQVSCNISLALHTLNACPKVLCVTHWLLPTQPALPVCPSPLSSEKAEIAQLEETYREQDATITVSASGCSHYGKCEHNCAQTMGLGALIHVMRLAAPCSFLSCLMQLQRLDRGYQGLAEERREAGKQFEQGEQGMLGV